MQEVLDAILLHSCLFAYDLLLLLKFYLKGSLLPLQQYSCLLCFLFIGIHPLPNQLAYFFLLVVPHIINGLFLPPWCRHPFGQAILYLADSLLRRNEFPLQRILQFSKLFLHILNLHLLLIGLMQIMKLIAQILYFRIKLIRHYYIITDEKKERERGQYDGGSHREGITTYQPPPARERRTEEEAGSLWEGVEKSQHLERIAEGLESRNGARVQSFWD